MQLQSHSFGASNFPRGFQLRCIIRSSRKSRARAPSKPRSRPPRRRLRASGRPKSAKAQRPGEDLHAPGRMCVFIGEERKPIIESCGKFRSLQENLQETKSSTTLGPTPPEKFGATPPSPPGLSSFRQQLRFSAPRQAPKAKGEPNWEAGNQLVMPRLLSARHELVAWINTVATFQETWAV